MRWIENYVMNPKTTAIHGLCILDYYFHIILYLLRRVQQSYFFIFSDEIEWGRNSLNIQCHCQYFDCNQGEESNHNMRLMSIGKDHIFDNSCFKWCEALIYPKLDKIAFVLQNCFVNQADVVDLLPQS